MPRATEPSFPALVRVSRVGNFGFPCLQGYRGVLQLARFHFLGGCRAINRVAMVLVEGGWILWALGQV